MSSSCSPTALPRRTTPRTKSSARPPAAAAAPDRSPLSQRDQRADFRRDEELDWQRRTRGRPVGGRAPELAAGLFVQTFREIATRTGIAAEARLPEFERARDAVRAVPGVAEAALSFITPFTGGFTPPLNISGVAGFRGPAVGEPGLWRVVCDVRHAGHRRTSPERSRCERNTAWGGGQPGVRQQVFPRHEPARTDDQFVSWWRESHAADDDRRCRRRRRLFLASRSSAADVVRAALTIRRARVPFSLVLAPISCAIPDEFAGRVERCRFGDRQRQSSTRAHVSPSQRFCGRGAKPGTARSPSGRLLRNDRIAAGRLGAVRHHRLRCRRSTIRNRYPNRPGCRRRSDDTARAGASGDSRRNRDCRRNCAQFAAVEVCGEPSLRSPTARHRDVAGCVHYACFGRSCRRRITGKESCTHESRHGFTGELRAPDGR